MTFGLSMASILSLHSVLAICVIGIAVADGSTIRVALYTGHGVTDRAKHDTAAVLNYKGSGIVATSVDEAAVRLLSSDNYDVVFFPGGGGTAISNAIGPAGRTAVKKFVQQGGGYVGVCAGAFLASQHLGMSSWGDTTRPVTGKVRGDGNCTIRLTREGVEDLSGFGVNATAVNATSFFYANGPVMSKRYHNSMIARPRGLIVFTSKSVPIEKNYVGPNAGYGRVAVGVNNFGAGLVLVSGPHPEVNEMDFPHEHGPPSQPGSTRAALLQSYVKRVQYRREEILFL